MRRLLIGCAALALLSAPAAAQHYNQHGYHAPRYNDHYVAPKPKHHYQGNYHYQPKPRYREHHGYQREHYAPPVYHAPTYRY